MSYFFSIFFGTFVLEDVTLALALGLVSKGQVSIVPAFLACFLGISIGDIGLYFLGRFASRCGLDRRFDSIRQARARLVRENHQNILTYSVVISRFVPGARLPTYLIAGVLKFPLTRFLIITIMTVGTWVILAFILGQSIRHVLMDHWILTVLTFLLLLRLIKFIIPKLSDPWERRSLFHSWRQLLSFEFWPAPLFYLPIVPYYIYLSIRNRSILAPFYANPQIENAGLIGESKWDFLKYLDPNSPSTLRTFKIKKKADFAVVQDLLNHQSFSYPFIIKPDVGQRGFGVRIIRNEFDLTEYLLLADFDMIVQELSRYSCEAGIFYVRQPHEKNGFIFSLTDKQFPFLIGDGKTMLGDLILKDNRARIIASTYFSRHRQSLNKIPANNQKVILSECGNHCQGAIFLNGKHMMTPELRLAIESLASQIPHFYFGRFDIRYQDAQSLMNGHRFEIVEVNGAGSEATHIWDPSTRLIDAYWTLFRQWELLFEIGAQIKKSKSIKSNLNLKKFIQEIFKVYFRKDPLSISS